MPGATATHSDSPHRTLAALIAVGWLAAVLLAGVVAVLTAIILHALSQSDAVLAGATVVLLVAAGIVANTLFRVLGDDGD